MRTLNLDDVHVEEFLEHVRTSGGYARGSLLLLEIEQMMKNGTVLTIEIIQEMYKKEVTLLFECAKTSEEFNKKHSSDNTESVTHSPDLVKDAIQNMDKEED